MAFQFSLTCDLKKHINICAAEVNRSIKNIKQGYMKLAIFLNHDMLSKCVEWNGRQPICNIKSIIIIRE